MRPRTRSILLAAILLLLAISVAISVNKARVQERFWKSALLVRNPQFLHCERLQVAVVQAAMDAVVAPMNAAYRADYRHQHMQIQADWIGMERLAASDPRHQSQLLEIRASIADLLLVLDSVSASTTPLTTRSTTSLTTSDQAHLQAALQRAQSALSNYAGSLEQESAQATAHSGLAWFKSVWISLTMLFLFCVVLILTR